MLKRVSGVTLLELLITTVILALISVGLGHILFFSYIDVVSADQRSKLQHQIAFVFEHMTKHITGYIYSDETRGGAIGYWGNWPVIMEAGGHGIRVRIDSNADGRLDGNDIWIAYRHENIGIADSEIRFYPDITNTPEVSESLGHHLVRTADNGVQFSGNFVLNGTTNQNELQGDVFTVEITGRWWPDRAADVKNPEIRMRTRIKTPTVSLNRDTPHFP